ncbi:AT-hook motif nuclear-localized protein 17-like [Ananas comosus]|uniref:AT-hook motif nuclear-localized protein 17-like n=1 Tax=Ananas comosus TaxID=4615 RepID=A0A6P5FCV9_ANACO|nr:AT-hook motif nuclear-localized protein 17-like [Ananas comosus]
MRPHVLEIRPGHDVADALARFVRGRGVGICVLSAHGAVSDGQVLGGTVAGPMVAAETVVVVAAAFSNPAVHRVPADDDDDPTAAAPEEDRHHQRRGPAPPRSAALAGAPVTSVYGAHFPSEVAWAPTARPPPPPPPPHY